MNIHKNARHTPRVRERLVRLVLSGLSLERPSRFGGLSPRSLRKWVKRYEEEGAGGLEDRFSRPFRLRAQAPDKTVRQIIALRR